MAETQFTFPDWSKWVYELAPSAQDQRDFFKSFGIEVDEEDMKIYEEVIKEGREKYGLSDEQT